MQEQSRVKIALVGWIQWLEPIVVAIVGFLAIFPERFSQQNVLIGLALLSLPLFLRLVVLGQVTVPNLANLPILLLLLCLGATYWVTPSWQHTWPQWVRMVWGVALYLAVVNWINPAFTATKRADEHLSGRELRQPPPRLVTATALFLGMGVIVTVIGLLGMRYPNKIDALDLLLRRLPDFFESDVVKFNSNNVAGIVVLFVPLAIALMVGPLQLRQQSLIAWLMVKGPVALLVLFFSVALLLTQTRGAWLAAGCALVVILGLLGRRGRVLMVVLGLLLVAGIFALGPQRILSELIVRDSDAADTGSVIEDRNLAARFILWQRAVHGIADAPLTGMGLGAFEIVSQEPYPQVDGFVPDPDMTHVHNIVLQTGVDFGIPGMIAFIALLLIMGWMLVQLVRKAAAPSLLHTWSVGLLGSFVAYLVHNTLNATELGSLPSAAVWFLFGLCVGAGTWAQQQAMPIENSFSQPAFGAPGMDEQEPDWAEWERRAWAATAGVRSQSGKSA